MKAGTTHEYLVALLDIIIQERDCARNLDVEGMAAATQVKEQLIQVLAHVKVIDEDDKPLAAKIRHENRRNAYLFKSALGWIRDTMEFFGRRTVTSTYTAAAGKTAAHVNGRLLSGKV
ncbi:flagellar protein FlgN [Desulfosediminicola flagellatus]|uniref:flagellar protein FlgN n=1 Tax=Desulfosediminicola flagellatus TaxID=2569541 RepID=UPI0010AC4BB9|nr:flagellar protein FlgN [Desulfosediminicola flagellatus]